MAKALTAVADCFSGKALPFIQRGMYQHLKGRRKGEPYTLLDILQVCSHNMFELYGRTSHHCHHTLWHWN